MIRPPRTLLPLVLVLVGAVAFGASPVGQPFSSTAQLTPTPRTLSGQDKLPSNSIIDLELFGPYLYGATGEGLTRFRPVPGGEPSEGGWLQPTLADGFGRGGVSGLAIGTTSDGDTVVWAATALDTSIAGESYAAGGGVGYSLDHGQTWSWMGQPVDDRDDEEISPTVTSVQNVTYDIGFLEDRAWIASWGGGLRYYDMNNPDQGWVNHPPDTDSYDVLEHLNHRAFSVSVMDTLLWVGTAAGVNLSRDNGETWQNFAHVPGSESSLSGNFVPSLGSQITSSGKRIIWAGTWSAESSTEYYGVSKSEDLGVTWTRVLGSTDEPVRAHNFAFQDSVVYVCTDDGLLKSVDYGETWGRFPAIRDLNTGERTYEPEIYSAAYGQDRLFVGGPEGLGVSADGGLTWDLLRSFPTPGESGQPDSYAYPNPFSPSRFAVVRFQYTLDSADNVTLEIYDFALELLIRPVKDAFRAAGDHSEVWDGRGPGGREIANGVYFYRLTGGGKERWGKVLVLD
ncbi:hypothetical protein KQI63_03350 [bacterium]|nr:hypothetical protein [bacterium]